MPNRVIFFFILFLVVYNLCATEKDSLRTDIVHKGIFLKNQVLPAGLFATAILLNTGTIKQDIQNFLPDTRTSTDNYFQYIPMMQIYIFDLWGTDHKNSVFDQTKYLALSQLSAAILVHTLKPLAGIERPGGADKSFPSGHTTLAFVGATALYNEFIDSEPLLAYSGFLFATATGVLRITNNKHWLPDVLAGAGIGILATNLVYHFEPLKNWQPFKKPKIACSPLITPNSLALRIVF